MRKFILSLIFVLSLCVPCMHGQTAIFVSTNGNNNNNGTTWETAKATLASAVAAATGTTHIYMKVGTYSCNNVAIPNGVTVTGGYKSASTGTDTTQRLFPGTNANWSNANLCTILDGNNTSRVATVNSGGKLEGCIVQHGKVTGNGGGVLVNGGTVFHCVIIHNSALDETNLSAKGGGAYVQNNGFLLNCVVAYNYANNGPAVAGTDGTLTNNTITANYTMANCGTVNDIDGNTYNTVIIGEQCWMKENLRTTRFADGVSIALGTTTSTSVAYRYNPNNAASNVTTYGYLYNWYAVMHHGAASSTANPSGVRGVCPTGWHVPSDSEWTQLTSYLQNHNAYICGGTSTYIAKALASKTGWNSSTVACCVGNDRTTNNSTGFGAMPAGYYGGSYYDFGNYASYWSSTQSSSTAASYRYLYSNYAYVGSSNSTKGYAYSVRCLRDQ